MGSNSWFGKGTALAIVILGVGSANGNDEPHNSESHSPTLASNFEFGRLETTATSGVLFSPFVVSRDRPVINYTITELQLGYMLLDSDRLRWFHGNLEVIADGFGSGIYSGPGNYIAGGTLWLRYNFVPDHWRIAPYVQGGGGFTFTDIDRGIVGERFNFNLDAAIGARWFVRQNWSLNLEYRYQHISNANLGHHNLGINAHGPVLGISYFF